MKRIILLGIFSVLMFSYSAYSQKEKAIKVGVVDVESVVKAMPDAVKADQDLKDLQKSYNDSLVKMQEDFYKRIEQYQKQRTMMAADQQQKEEESLKNYEQILIRYRDEKLQDIQKRREEYLDPIRKAVKEAIEVVAKEEEMNFIFDKANAIVLYSDDKYDFTYKVIDKMKREKTKKK
jgi:outer membrane protein